MKLNKLNLALTALVALSATGAWAEPLVKKNVDENAKWLLHFDFDQFRDSKLGQFIIKDIILPNAKAQANNLLTNLDVPKILGQLHSVTAWGTALQGGANFDGVLLLKVEPETRKILEGLAAGLLLQGPEGFLTKTNEDGIVIYSLHEMVCASPQQNELILFSRSKAQLKRAAAVLAGKGRSLAKSKAFSDFPAVNHSFFFLAVAEGFQENLPIPPQARVLRQADGARVVLGEKTDSLFLNVALKAKDSEVLKQIQQVVEGMLALASLTQSENKDFKELQQVLQSTKVEATDTVISVTTTVPVEMAINQAGRVMTHQRSHPHQKEKAGAAEKPEPKKPEASASNAEQQ